uniref:Carbonic anhydrase n=1 Tax=Panagrellus redivivus TaxID=6233 RepID=A0A7E4UX30_PANRE
MPGLNRVLQGVLHYRKTVRSDLVEQFHRVRDNPNPTAVFFTCMDSRMLPARITQSQVGDMFVVRNSGNMIPHARNYGMSGFEVSVTTEPAALELAVKRGKINHVIVCGHSDCKAINTLYNLHQCPKNFDPESPMDHWLRRHGYSSIQKLERRLKSEPGLELQFTAENALLLDFKAKIDPEDKFNIEDKLSQINTLQQLVHIASHGFLHEFLENHQVFLHAMWFDIYTGDMYMFSKQQKQFLMIDEETATTLNQEVDDEIAAFEH